MTSRRYVSKLLLPLVIAFLAWAGHAQGLFAQEAAAPPPQAIVQPTETAPAVAAPETPDKVKDDLEPSVHPNDMASVLFTFWEYTAIADAKRSRGLVRPPTEEELMRDLQSREVEKVKPPPEEREIRLAGIVYVSTGDWTIWLNGKRVTPTAIPKEVMDLKVKKEFIEMKWYDEYTNQIFPLRLRPHQRFNIDTRIFLPG